MNLLKEKIMKYEWPESVRNIDFHPFFRAIESICDAEVVMNGRKVILFGSNNYLGLTNHPKVTEAAKKAVDKYGTACAGSRVLNGTLDLHDELEMKIARLVGKDAAICFNCGFQANSGIVSILTGRNDYIIFDEYIHASIIEGSRLTFSKILKFAHNDLKALELKLKVCNPDSGKLIAVEGIYSMEGDMADLHGVVKLAEKYNAAVIVDDAHAIGVFGEDGAGTVKTAGLNDKVDLIVGTLSKSLASLGGFVAADKNYIKYLKSNARPLFFSASMTPASVASALAALDVMREEKERITHLHEISEYLRKCLMNEGFSTGKSVTPIIPLILYDDTKTMLMAQNLFEAGIFVNPVMTPAVPKGKSRLRISMMAAHTKQHVDYLVDNIVKINKYLEKNFAFSDKANETQNAVS